jgi:hypothetical protein
MVRSGVPLEDDGIWRLRSLWNHRGGLISLHRWQRYPERRRLRDAAALPLNREEPRHGRWTPTKVAPGVPG